VAHAHQGVRHRVPTFAPITMGMAVATGKPAATRATITEVTVLEDCTNAVAKAPMTSP